MYSFGINSLKHRSTCHPDLQAILDRAIKMYDFSIIWGHRNKQQQNKACADGYSELMWQTSKHNKHPSEAFDIVPYPNGFDNSDEEFYKMATYVLAEASHLQIPLRWGGHWKTIKDMAHFELRS